MMYSEHRRALFRIGATVWRGLLISSPNLGVPVMTTRPNTDSATTQRRPAEDQKKLFRAWFQKRHDRGQLFSGFACAVVLAGGFSFVFTSAFSELERLILGLTSGLTVTCASDFF